MKYEWEFDNRHSWDLTDKVHSKGWVTALINKGGNRNFFVVYRNSIDGCSQIGTKDTLEEAKELLDNYK